MKNFILSVVVLLCMSLSVQAENPEMENYMFELTSPAFKHMERIPAKYTCSGEDISPELHWEYWPANTKSFALIMDDPDATHGTWDHWVLYNIPANVTKLSEKDSASGKGGTNSWGKQTYGGPCPPPGKDHRYFFKLYALDVVLELDSSANKQTLLKAMEGYIIDKTELIGLYSR